MQVPDVGNKKLPTGEAIDKTIGQAKQDNSAEGHQSLAVAARVRASTSESARQRNGLANWYVDLSARLHPLR